MNEEKISDIAKAVFTNPAGDCSTSVNIGFQSPYEHLLIKYSPISSGKTAEENVLSVKGSLIAAEDYYLGSGAGMFTYKVTLNNLIPDRAYSFFISAEDGKRTSSHSFKTAGSDLSFSFGWIGDIHADPAEPDKMPTVDRMAAHLKKGALNERLDMILVSGDLVKFGNYFEAWCQWDRCVTASEHILATVPGNKEYYRVEDIEKDIVTEHYSGEWYEKIMNNPGNSPTGVEGTYYFLYNRVLFISINNCQEEAPENKIPVIQKEVLKAQQTWFEKTLTSLEGRYDYIVVQNHYAYFVHDYEIDPQTERACSWGRYADWHPLFDKYGVDFSLSGDYHEYCRSKRIYSDLPAKDSDHGTVYITYSQLTDRIDSLVLKDSEAPLVDKYEVGSSTGAGLFNVTPEEIVYKYYDVYGNVVDSIAIPKKNRQK